MSARVLWVFTLKVWSWQIWDIRIVEIVMCARFYEWPVYLQQLPSFIYIQYVSVTLPWNCWVSGMLPILLLHGGELPTHCYWKTLLFLWTPCITNFQTLCSLIRSIAFILWMLCNKVLGRYTEHFNIFVLKIATANEAHTLPPPLTQKQWRQRQIKAFSIAKIDVRACKGLEAHTATGIEMYPSSS